MDDLQVVDVEADSEYFAVAAVLTHEHTSVRVVERAQAVCLHPREDLALQTPASLWDAINGLDYFEHTRSAIRVELDITRSHVAVDNLTLEEFALQIRRDIVDAADLAAVASSVSEQASSRAIPKGCRECLVVVDALIERASLHTQSSFEGAIPLDLVPRRGMTISDFAFFEFSLEISGHEVPPANLHLVLRGVGGE